MKYYTITLWFPCLDGQFPAGNILEILAKFFWFSSTLVWPHMMSEHFSTPKWVCPAINTKILGRITKFCHQPNKSTENVTWSGDGRIESMGHCAKYGLYTMLCSPLDKIVHLELIEVWWQHAFKIQIHYFVTCSSTGHILYSILVIALVKKSSI